MLVFAFAGCTSSKGSTPVGKGRLEMGRQLVVAGEFSAAIRYLLPIAKESPKNAGVLTALGDAYLGAGEVAAAGTTYRKAFEADSRAFGARLNYGFTLVAQGKHLEARSVLQKLLEEPQFPDPEKVYVNLGLSYMEEGNWSQAVEEFRRATGSDPTLVAAHYNLGLSYVRLGRWKEAEGSLRKAAAFCPGCGEPALALAETLARSGQREEALKSLQPLLQSGTDKRTLSSAQRLVEKIQWKQGKR